MTIEEALEELKEIRFNLNYKVNGTSRFDEALDMAIRALEQEPCGDAISRQAVLDYIYNDLGLGDEENGKDAERQIELERSYKYVKSLPPITPHPKIERWIPDRCDMYICQNCSHTYTDLSGERYGMNFCPNCGCKMQEVEE